MILKIGMLLMKDRCDVVYHLNEAENILSKPCDYDRLTLVRDQLNAARHCLEVLLDQAHHLYDVQ
jgi:hypothetical protein